MKSGPFKPDRVGDGTGDVIAPATNTANFIPQWDGSNSKTLKDGKVAPSGTIVGTSDTQTLAAKAFSDRITSYNGLPFKGNGIPWIVSLTKYSERSTSIPETALLDGDGEHLPFGIYRITWHAIAHAEGSGGTGLVEIAWATALDFPVSDVSFDLTDTVGGHNTSSIVLFKSSTDDILYSVTMNGAAGDPTFDFAIFVELIGLLDGSLNPL